MTGPNCCGNPSLSERLFQRRRPEDADETQLVRTLNVWDVTLQGVSHMVGAGIMILVPVLIATKAGPCFFLSMLLAGSILGFTAVSYTDLSSRYTCIGNAYVYVYAAIGEYPAVLVASITIGEFLLHMPLIAKLCSQQINVMLFDGKFREMERNFYISSMGLPVALIDNTDFDIITFTLIMITLIFLLLPIKYSTVMSAVVLSLSVATLLVYCGFGLHKGTFSNLVAAKDPSHAGFMPFGAMGLVQCAAITAVFYSGFETTSSLAEECVNPKRDVPRGTLLSYFIVVILYVVTSFCMVYTAPWYTLKDGLLPTISEYPILQHVLGAAIVAISISVIISLSIADARIIYSVAMDGLYPKFLTRVSTITGIPFVSIILVCILFQVIAAIFTTDFITDLLSEGILSVYVCVNISLVCISYKHGSKARTSSTASEETHLLESAPKSSTLAAHLQEAVLIYPAERILLGVMLLFTTCCVIPVAVAFNVTSLTIRIVVGVLFGFCAVILLVFIHLYFVPTPPGYFKSPCKPYFQGLGIALSVLLMNSLKVKAILSIITYITLGSIIYFAYGVYNSKITQEIQKRKSTNLSSNNE